MITNGSMILINGRAVVKDRVSRVSVVSAHRSSGLGGRSRPSGPAVFSDRRFDPDTTGR
jgi:hypothetical protein